MNLGEKQRLFFRLQTELDVWILEQGYEVADGDAFRDPRAFGAVGEYAYNERGEKVYGHPKSAHKNKLARDKNLFINGVFQKTTEAHRPIGEKWKSMHPLNRWGGDFKRPDGNHYSMEHEGVS